MLLFLALAALGVVTLGSVLAYQRGAQARLLAAQGFGALPPHEEAPAEERTLETLRVGDVIVQGAEDWLIVGTCTYREEQDEWWLHIVDNGRERRWFEVRRRDGWVAAFFEEATDVPPRGTLYDGLTHKGLPFRLVRRGDARVTVDGEVGERRAGLLRYATYEGPGGGYLNVEEENGKRTSLSGERVVGEGLLLMPGERPAPLEPLLPGDEGEGELRA
jgi:hypothetical protein